MEREIVNKLSIFLIILIKRLNVNPRMMAIRFVMKEKKTMNLFFTLQAMPTKLISLEINFNLPVPLVARTRKTTILNHLT